MPSAHNVICAPWRAAPSSRARSERAGARRRRGSGTSLVNWPRQVTLGGNRELIHQLAGHPDWRTGGRGPRRAGRRVAVTSPGMSYPEIPAALHADAYWPAQSSDAVTKLSLITVSFMFAMVTHSGLARMDGTGTWATTSVTEPLTSDGGGVRPARRYIASAAVAPASR